jgi:hypothetical protein
VIQGTSPLRCSFSSEIEALVKRVGDQVRYMPQDIETIDYYLIFALPIW